MGIESLWFGFLDAGTKSSPVVRSSKFDTGRSNTIYLFNLNRNKFVEYERSTVEDKLRELHSDEKQTIQKLKKAYLIAVKDFIPRYKGISSWYKEKEAANDSTS